LRLLSLISKEPMSNGLNASGAKATTGAGASAMTWMISWRSMDLPESDKILNEQDGLRRLRTENARLKELLTHQDTAWEAPTAPGTVPAPSEPPRVPPISPPTTRSPCSVACSGVARMFIRSAGSRPKAHPAIHRPVVTSGSPASATSPV